LAFSSLFDLHDWKKITTVLQLFGSDSAEPVRLLCPPWHQGSF